MHCPALCCSRGWFLSRRPLFSLARHHGPCVSLLASCHGGHGRCRCRCRCQRSDRSIDRSSECVHVRACQPSSLPLLPESVSRSRNSTRRSSTKRPGVRDPEPLWRAHAKPLVREREDECALSRNWLLLLTYVAGVGVVCCARTLDGPSASDASKAGAAAEAPSARRRVVCLLCASCWLARTERDKLN